MKKGGQQLMDMGKRLPKTTEDLPPYRGEENITYNPDLAALAEGKEVFEEGYVYPQEMALQPPSTPAPLSQPPMEDPSRWQDAMEFAASFEPPPVDPKQEQINNINAKIDSLGSVMQQTIGEQQVRQQEDDLIRQQILEQAPPALDPQQTGYGMPSEVPTPPPPAAAPMVAAPAAPVVPAPPPPPTVEEPLYTRYTYELPVDEILGLKDIPNDKLLMAPRYEDRETMISELNAMLADKQPLPPVVFAGDEAVRLAENSNLERWIMSPNDIKLYNAGLVSLLIEELDAQRKGSE